MLNSTDMNIYSEQPIFLGGYKKQPLKKCKLRKEWSQQAFRVILVLSEVDL